MPVAESSQQLRNLADVEPLSDYLRSIWKRRRYTLEVPIADFRVQNMHTVLGQLWHLLNPAMLMGVYYIVFGLLLQTNRGVDNFLLFLAAGLFSFRFTQIAATKGAAIIPRNLGLIRSIRFPRAILPISTTFAQLLSHVPILFVLVALALATGESPSARWLLLIPVTGLQMLFNLGLVCITARVGEKIRDLTNVLPFFFRLLFYASGILYAVDRYVDDPRLVQLFAINPLYSYVELTRYAILEYEIDPLVLVSASLWTLLIVPIGLIIFKRGEAQYGRP